MSKHYMANVRYGLDWQFISVKPVKIGRFFTLVQAAWNIHGVRGNRTESKLHRILTRNLHVVDEELEES